MAFGAVKILDVNGLSYLYTKLNNNITDFQNTSKAIIDSAAAAANNAAERANAITGNIDSTYATKEELATAIGKITSFEFLIVSSLPNPGAKGTIYLVESTSGNQSSVENKNTYDEFIWVGSKYEKIGTTDINLSDYMNAADIADTYLSKTDASTTYATKGEVSTLDSKVDANTVAISKAVSTVASQGLTDEEKSNARANIGAQVAGNYAGSSSAGGSATSAVKLATARTITLSGAVTGSANFDGSANITITNKVAYGTSAPSSLADGSLYCVYE